jgi:hypothetical protein
MWPYPELEQRWKQTGNPLYVCEAVALSLTADPPVAIPHWCLPYLAEAMHNLTQLAWGIDFRSGERLSPPSAAKLVSRALGLSRQGSKSAFHRVADDRQDQRAALDDRYNRGRGGQISAERTITPRRARRRIKRGSELLP